MPLEVSVLESNQSADLTQKPLVHRGTLTYLFGVKKNCNTATTIKGTGLLAFLSHKR